MNKARRDPKPFKLFRAIDLKGSAVCTEGTNIVSEFYDLLMLQ